MANKYQKAWQKICNYAYGNGNLSYEQFQDMNNDSGRLIQELVDRTVCDSKTIYKEFIQKHGSDFILTEQVCFAATEDLKNHIEMILGEESDLIECINLLNQLISEHFLNRPLSFDELVVGEPVFDDHTKSWLIVTKKNQIHDIGHYPTFQVFHGEEFDFEEIEFENDRYFKEKVIE